MDEEGSPLSEPDEAAGTAPPVAAPGLEAVDDRLFGRPLGEVQRVCDAAGVGDLFELIERRHRDLQLSLQAGVRACAVDPNLSNARLKAATGLTFHQLLTRRRVRAAAGRLAAGDRLPLDRVARGCGFGSLRSLERNFRRFLGMTPSRFRRLALRGVEPRL